MKFGVLQFFGWKDRHTPLPAIYERAMERMELMDKSGYDATWLAEHHFTGYSVCPSVHMMGVQVASRTQRIRIGTGVSLAALYHPLRLAEEVAFLDVISGGRVNWGAGRGFDPVEFRAFGVTPQESGPKFHEAVDIVRTAWTQERMSYNGRYWKFQDVEVLPKPLQQPHPPIWLAAGSDGAVKWAARNDYAIMLGPHSTFDETAQHRDLYQTTLEMSGFSFGDRDLPMARFIAVGRTDDEAEEVARSGVRWVAGAYMNSKKATNPGSKDQLVLTMNDAEKLERYIRSVVIHGCPERVVDKIEQLRATMGLDYLMCAPLSNASFLNFTHKVMPHFM